MNDSLDLWKEWPLAHAMGSKPPAAIAFSFPAGTDLPRQVDEAIRLCSAREVAVYIIWVAATYVVLERVEPVTDDEEKADIETSGFPWQMSVSQAFDIIPTADVARWEDDAVQEWYEKLRVLATDKAERYFTDPNKIPLFVDSDSTSNEFPSSVLFSVGGISWVHTRINRSSVMEWADSVYAQLIAITMVSPQITPMRN